MSANELSAGIACIDITPSEPIWLHGWGNRKQPSSGVSQRLFAKALAVENADGERFVWVGTDMLGFSRKMIDALNARAMEKFKLDAAHLIINSSHNHSAPVTGDVLHLYFEIPDNDLKVIARYTDWMHDRIIEVIEKAMADLSPAELSFGQGFAGFAVNRRRVADRTLPGVVDHDVPVLAVRDPKSKKLRGVVFGYACHTTCIEDGTINGDWAGYAQETVERMHPGATAIFVTGCGADANPLPRFWPGVAQTYGNILGQSVAQVLKGEMKIIRGPLRGAMGAATLPYETLPTRKQLDEMLAQATTDNKRREVQFQIDALNRDGKLPQSCQYNVAVWRFGDGDLLHVALTGETVADYALRFKQQYGWYNTWVSGYNDDMIAYVPSDRVLREGGYEGRDGMLEYTHPAAFADGIEGRIAGKVQELINQTIQAR